MKRIFLPIVITLLWVVSGHPCHGGIGLPYAPDTQTLHLWHFDEAMEAQNATDSISNGAISLQLVGLLPLGTNVAFGTPSWAGLGNALKIYDRNGFAKGKAFMDTTPFTDDRTGAFTFEAIIRLEINPLSAKNHMEIICGDGNQMLAGRGWQFRISNKGELEFNVLAGSDSNDYRHVPLPTNGPDAAFEGKWYHVAVSFTGTKPANGEPAHLLKFYWTLLDNSRTRANQLAEFVLTRGLSGEPLGESHPNLGIGGSCRSANGPANGEALIGFIDEVRISKVARRADQMAFH